SRGLNQATARPSVGVIFPVANSALSYPHAGLVPVASNICYACNVWCKNATTLTKHQNEFCERKVKWICPACPQKVFGLQERLNRHHMEAHAYSCLFDCNKRKSYTPKLANCSFPSAPDSLRRKKHGAVPAASIDLN